MTQTSFTIKGNHQTKDGNAVPKLKMTGKQHWTKKAQDYVKWKEHVQTAYLDTLKGNQHAQRIAAMNMAKFGKPIVIDDQHKSAKMDIVIAWANEKHGDPENIFGSIADALFVNDEHLVGSFDAYHDDVAGSVEVKIKLINK